MNSALSGTFGRSQGNGESVSQPSPEVVAVWRGGFIDETEERGCNIRSSAYFGLIAKMAL